MICEACTNRVHWDCAGAGCRCDCNPDAVLAAMEEPMDPLVALPAAFSEALERCADDDDTSCPFCGEAGCERSCTGALREDAGEDET